MAAHVIASLFALIFLIFGGFRIVFGALDVTHHHLDFVARHLAILECRKLSESLHMKHVQLDHAVDGKLEPHLHCLELLKHWSAHEGRRQTLETLVLRLGQIGREDLGNALEDLQIKEIKDALARTAFNDTYLGRTPMYKEEKEEGMTQKEFIEKAKKEFGERPEGSPDPEERKMTMFHYVAIALAVAAVITVIVAIILVNRVNRKSTNKCGAVECYYKDVRNNYYMETKGQIPRDVET